ncbi:transposase [Stenotrophomonas sp.]|uniref:transposase n=1 Tax=Stenotrophomonas sp. TaxID=69392 RepID=UPI0028A9744E|nr:transposase [Stenotrophomonas sp.]
MSEMMGEEIKRWTARRNSALVLEIIQGKTTVAAASRQFDLNPTEIENWVEYGKRGVAQHGTASSQQPGREADCRQSFQSAKGQRLE